MSNPARKHTTTEETQSVVVPIHRDQRNLGFDSKPPYSWNAFFSGQALESHLKSILDGLVLDAYIKDRFQTFGNADDPFDAIYISELRPDQVTRQEIEQLEQYQEIVDISDTIGFSDYWED